MRNIDASIIAELESSEFRPFLLFDSEIDSVHYRYTNCDVPVVYNGNVYTPRGFSVSEIQYSLSKIVDQATIEMDNLDSVFTSLFVGGDPRGSLVILSLVVLDSNGQIIKDVRITEAGDIRITEAGDTRILETEGVEDYSVILFEGDLDTWDLDEKKVRLILASEATRWPKTTLVKQASSCRWKVFKGTECGYSGSETWCDRSYARCEQLSNTDNFGGERWLPSIVDKEIWWGKKPK